MAEIDWLTFPPVTALRALEATARTGSFTQAAVALNVTHAAVTQQVRGLERHLGLSLVRRQGRAIEMTEEGARLAQAVGDGFATIAATLSALRSERFGGGLSVTMTPLFAERWLVPRLKNFWKTCPDIALTLRPDARVTDLVRERIDLGIRFGNGAWPGVTAGFLTSARFMIVGAPALLQGRTDLSLTAMAALPWVAESDSADTISWLAGQGFDTARLAITELPTEELALSAARQGIGLHVASAALVEQDLARGDLILLHDSGDDNPAYYIVAPPGPQSPAARTFVRWLKSAV